MPSDNIVLACYLTRRPDPQRGTLWPADDDATVQTWIESVHVCRLRGIIFHDDLSEAFIARWEDEAVRFERVEWGTAGSALEERFRIYRDWLQGREVERVMTTDLSDAEYLKNPFRLINDPNRIYIGSELNHIGNTCIAEWSRRAYGSVLYPDRVLLNPGILGGHRATLIGFLNRLLQELEQVLRRTAPPVDMAVLNRLIYRERIPFVTGQPLHTIFRRNEGLLSGAAIRHK
jgi:hypothetical protein